MNSPENLTIGILLARKYLKHFPEMTLDQFLDSLSEERGRAAQTRMFSIDPCKRCGRPVEAGSSDCIHLAPNMRKTTVRNCYSASSDWLDGVHDESLNSRWKATSSKS